jgi:hypothetical protein
MGKFMVAVAWFLGVGLCRPMRPTLSPEKGKRTSLSTPQKLRRRILRPIEQSFYWLTQEREHLERRQH